MKILLIFATLFIANGILAQTKKDSIQPISSCVSELYVPNVFSGSGDSVNDTFLPRLAGNPATYEFTIYDRWGEVIFKTTKVNEGWNGRYREIVQPEDVYVWMIKFTCNDSEEKYSFTGHVTVLR